MFTSEIMTPRPTHAAPEMTVDRALALLRRGRFRHLPVVSDGRLYGVLSDRDLQRASAAGTPGDAAIRPLAHAPAITVTPETPAEDCALLMEENKIGCVPVVDGERLVGIVTDSDVLRAFARGRGVHQPGSRLVVALRNVTHDLLAASLVLHEHNLPVLSLATEPAAEDHAAGADHTLRLVVRLGTINPGPVAAALRQAGLQCVEPALVRIGEDAARHASDAELPAAPPAALPAAY